MPKGKPWKVKEELLLKHLINQGEKMDVIAAKMGKTTNSVYLKTKRMGLKEEVTKCGAPSSSNEQKLPPKLPTKRHPSKTTATTNNKTINRTAKPRLRIIPFPNSI